MDWILDLFRAAYDHSAAALYVLLVACAAVIVVGAIALAGILAGCRHLGSEFAVGFREGWRRRMGRGKA